ncbi:hypothetical protein [Rhizobium ruizarguesonis]|uniref:hypothetical protein n=1 Tax=Rhizobium ruizarguesonis TaxID=2081791 RepID=UPI001031AD44|nr:hypothetical protein [Rhizobium ruizarguesonis]TAT69887.1 hypothetical protein ELI52_39080 [Rhizobium ruizarguesonis]
MADDIKTAEEVALDKFYLATKGFAKDKVSDLTTDDVKVIASAFDELQRQTNWESVERDVATGEYTVSGYEVSYSEIVEDDNTGRHGVLRVVFDREDGMATDLNDEALGWLKGLNGNGSEKPSTITDDQWAMARLPATYKKLDALFEGNPDWSSDEHLRQVVDLLSELPEGHSYTTSDDTNFKLMDGKVTIKDVDPERDEKHWAIYDANDLSLIDGSVQRLEAENMRQEEYAYRGTLDEVIESFRENGQSEMEWQPYGTFRLEGDMITLTQSGGDVSARHLDDLDIELTAEQIENSRDSVAAIQAYRSHVSNAVLDEVFQSHADAHMRSVHDFDGRETPALSSEQVAQLSVQTPEDDKLMQIAREIENGFPSEFMGDELHELRTASNFARDYWAENSPHPTPFMETPSEDQVAELPAAEGRVLRFKAMADRADAAAARGSNTERTLETTNEQGA